MVLLDDQWKFGSPKGDEPVAFLFFIFIDGKVNIGGYAIDVFYCIALWIKGLGIGEVVNEIGKSFGHFIGVFGGLLVFFPPFQILFYKLAFSHKVKRNKDTN